MAQFQETRPREDHTPKVGITKDDVTFLKQLQHELCTQDTMGNADPRFWVIRQSGDKIPAPEDYGDGVVVLDHGNENAEVATDLESFAKYLDSGEVDHIESCAYFNRSVKIVFDDKSSAGAYSLAGIVETVNEACGTDFIIQSVYERSVNVPDTLFLTHADCEDHLRKYDYNYKPDAHAYAMTAIRSPRFEQLIKLLQTADWDKAFPEDA